MKNKYDIFLSPQSLASLNKDSSVLLAYSGGADSRALFDLSARYCRENGGYFYAAHVNHGIRGDEAIRDRDFCISVAKSCPECREMFVLDADVPKMAADSGRSLELEARLLRYSFFNNILKEKNIGILVTAHNADDNLETLIFNLARGSGGRGMRGIPRVRTFEGGDILRPILDMTKAEILDYCRENSLEFVTDSTNECTDYSRNLIRAKIVPLLEEINPEARHAALRLSDSMRELCELAEESAESYDTSVSSIAHAPAAILPIILGNELSRSGSDAMLESVHILAIRDLCEKGKNGSSLSIPGGMRAVIRGERLFFEPDTGRLDAEKEKTDFYVTLSMGKNLLPSGYTAELTDSPVSSESIALDTNAIRLPLVARNRREGDKILSGGMHKSVKKLMCDKKIPKEERDSLPIICDGDGILLIPSVAIRDKVKDNNGKISVTIYK